jgi:hypothetical protein
MSQFNAEEWCRSQDVPERLPHLFTANQWAWVLRNRDSNGLSPAVKRLGKTLSQWELAALWKDALRPYRRLWRR